MCVFGLPNSSSKVRYEDMYIDFSSIFHRSSKDLGDKGNVYIPQDDTKWPPEWTTIYYKSYPRVKKIPLERKMISGDLASILASRRSHRDFTKRKVDISQLSKLLLHACGLQKDVKTFNRTHPSGGGRYPIEIYPIIFQGNRKIPAGVYHYNIKEHTLDVLWQREFTSDDISELFVYDWIQNASFALICTGEFWRNQMKYGERGYRYVLLDAGHVSENIYLVAESLGLKCCGMGGTRDENIEKLLDIDGVNESLVHSLILG